MSNASVAPLWKFLLCRGFRGSASVGLTVAEVEKRASEVAPFVEATPAQKTFVGRRWRRG